MVIFGGRLSYIFLPSGCISRLTDVNLGDKKLYFNERFFIDNKYRKIIDNIEHIFNSKHFILNKNINNKTRDDICIKIDLIRLLDNNYCESCNEWSDYFGYCIEHYNQDKINKYRNEFLNEYSNCKIKRDYYYKYNYNNNIIINIIRQLKLLKVLFTFKIYAK